MTFEHLTPESRGGRTVRSNLWLACSQCNAFKSNLVRARDPESGRLVRLFNPRRQIWSAHFRWIESGLRIEGRTPTGRATVAALRLNREVRIMARRLWISAGWHPPSD
ncbi:MAG: HNH endonuclease [Zavarzinella sp.]|nr:HNH endonuclease [Zavarzinella sp.]